MSDTKLAPMAPEKARGWRIVPEVPHEMQLLAGLNVLPLGATKYALPVYCAMVAEACGAPSLPEIYERVFRAEKCVRDLFNLMTPDQREGAQFIIEQSGIDGD